MSELIHNPMTWVIASFIGFLLLAARFNVHKMALGALDSRSAEIQKELDTARALREEAEAVLMEYKRKQEKHLQEAEEMLERARKEANAMREAAEKDLLDNMDKRMQAAMQRIEQQERQALNDVRNHVVDITIAAAKDMIADHFKNLSSEQMVQSVVADLERKVH